LQSEHIDIIDNLKTKHEDRVQEKIETHNAITDAMRKERVDGEKIYKHQIRLLITKTSKQL
jgi:hypothetical protein